MEKQNRKIKHITRELSHLGDSEVVIVYIQTNITKI